MKAKYVVLSVALISGVVLYSTHKFGGGTQTKESATASSKNNVARSTSDAASTPSEQQHARATRKAVARAAPHLVAKPVFPPDLAANFDALKSRAEHGDADAAYALASALFVCETQTSREVQDKCRNLSRKQMDEYPELLEIAASRGNAGAQVAYAPMIAPLFSRDENLMMDENAIRSFKYKTMTYLRDAAAKGSFDALNQLAIIYQSGHFTPRDPVAAYAYMYATSRTGLIPTSSMVLSKWSRNLNQSDMALAVRRGEAIYRSCCGAN